jgi:UDP-GlcNAc:undecaprenyl-phosphate GlcNAc-1-phosphate transferase
MNFNSMQWVDNSIIIWFGVSLFLNALASYLWYKKIYLKLGLENYQAIQRIHLNETPRLGGAIYLITLTGYVAYSNTSESAYILKTIFFCLIPIILTGLKEDLFHNVRPAIRLISLFFAAWLFRMKFTGALPILDNIPIIGMLFFIQGGASLFYILSITAIANGMNMIDGVNGLCVAIALSILSTLLFLCYKTTDTVLLSVIFTLILLLIPFACLNYPFGRIFLGDLGAYSLGFIVSALTIIFFGRHPEISPWGGVLVLIYPATEVIFSLLRRVANGISVFNPDTIHLHLKLYNYFKERLYLDSLANALVTPVLCMLWIFPFIAITFTYKKQVFIWISIALFMIIYILIYLGIPKSHDKKNNYINYEV